MTPPYQVHAIDDDLDSNGLIHYSVSDPDNFAIDEGGVLTNVRPLDYEHTKGEYLFYVYAEDQGEQLCKVANENL